MTGRVVIVGAGACGGTVAVMLRTIGFEGSLTLVGDEALAPYERPPLSKAALTGDDAPVPSTIHHEDRLAELGVDFVGGAPAVAIDRVAREVELKGGRRVGYDRLVLATGARPRPLPVPGGDSALMLRTVADAHALRDALVPGTRAGIIGGGFIGLEVAASAVSRGCDVTVVELAPSVMGRVVPRELAGAMAVRHGAAGVRLRCGVGVDRIEADGDGWRVVLDDGASVACDVVLAGVGALPNTDLAQAAGLAIDNGIATDATLATSDPTIFAAGDCCSFPHPLYGGQRLRLEAWRNALDQAEAVAHNVLGAGEPYARVPWFWTDQYELSLYMAGLPQAASREVLRERTDGVVLRLGLDDSGRLVSASALAEGTVAVKDLRLAERLIAARAHPERGELADPGVSLKGLLSA